MHLPVIGNVGIITVIVGLLLLPVALRAAARLLRLVIIGVIIVALLGGGAMIKQGLSSKAVTDALNKAQDTGKSVVNTLNNANIQGVKH
jgi:hypothetical protein